MRIALVHDWLLNLGGAERVLIAFHKIFPEAPIFTLLYKESFTKKYLPNAKIVPSFLQRLPLITKIYHYLPFLMPIAVESLRPKNFDLVLASDIAFSKGLILKQNTRLICYCHSPTRWLWDWSSEYHKEFEKRGPLKYVGVTLYQHLARIWDKTASNRIDQYIANSKHVANRIYKYYRKQAMVIYPPLTQLPTTNHQSSMEYFLIVSQLYKHKNIDIAIKAFAKLKWPLVIIGRGPQKEALKKMAKKLGAKNIIFKGFVNDQELAQSYQNCLAFLYPQEEDFGITAVEAMSFGKPVLALKKGGAIESVIEGVTGEFFDDAHPVVLADGVRRIYEKIKTGYYSPLVIKKHSEKFSEERFKEKILDILYVNSS